MLETIVSIELVLLTARPPVGTLEPLTTWSGVATTLKVEVNSKGLLYPLWLFLSPQAGAADTAVAQRPAAAMLENFMLIYCLFERFGVIGKEF